MYSQDTLTGCMKTEVYGGAGWIVSCRERESVVIQISSQHSVNGGTGRTVLSHGYWIRHWEVSECWGNIYI